MNTENTNRSNNRTQRTHHRRHQRNTNRYQTNQGQTRVSRREDNQTTSTKKSGPRRSHGQGASAKKNQRKHSSHRDNRRSMTNPALSHRMAPTDSKGPILPEVIDEDVVRIIPMSGVEQIGRNMTIVETKDDIIIFDIGFNSSQRRVMRRVSTTSCRTPNILKNGSTKFGLWLLPTDTSTTLAVYRT